MSRYIDADIEITVNSYDAEYEEIKIRSDTIANFLDEFSDEGCPEFVDAIPVIHGKWIKGRYTDDDIRYNDWSYRCNKCEKHVNYIENFCPGCGAKMDGKEQT